MPVSPCTTPSGSGRGVHPEHTWQAVQHWESIQDEKTGTFLLIFLSFGAFLKICSFFHWSKRQQDQPDQPLPVQRPADPAEESTLKMPDRLTSLGSQSYGWKNGYLSIAYFYHFVHYLKSAVFPLFHWPKRQQINQARLSLYNAERIQPRTGHGTRPPPIEAGKRPLVQGFVNKNSVKTPYPMEVVRLLEYHQSKMPLLSGT